MSFWSDLGGGLLQGVGGILGATGIGAIPGAVLGGLGKSLGGSVVNSSSRSQSLSDWNRVNEYNSPAAQMERFKAAGLNPNLIYGHGTAGNAGEVPQAGHFDTSSEGGISSYQRSAAANQELKAAAAMNKANVDKIESETRLNNVRANNLGQSSMSLEEERRQSIGRYSEWTNPEMRKARLDTARLIAQKTEAESYLSYAQSHKLAVDTEVAAYRYRDKVNLSLTQIASEIARNHAQSGYYHSRGLQADALAALARAETVWRKYNISPNDPIGIRVAVGAANGIYNASDVQRYTKQAEDYFQTIDANKANAYGKWGLLRTGLNGLRNLPFGSSGSGDSYMFGDDFPIME